MYVIRCLCEYDMYNYYIYIYIYYIYIYTYICYSMHYNITGSFKLYDINHDGYISKEEVTTIVDAFYKMIVSYYL